MAVRLRQLTHWPSPRKDLDVFWQAYDLISCSVMPQSHDDKKSLGLKERCENPFVSGSDLSRPPRVFTLGMAKMDSSLPSVQTIEFAANTVGQIATFHTHTYTHTEREREREREREAVPDFTCCSETPRVCEHQGVTGEILSCPQKHPFGLTVHQCAPKGTVITLYKMKPEKDCC